MNRKIKIPFASQKVKKRGVVATLCVLVLAGVFFACTKEMDIDKAILGKWELTEVEKSNMAHGIYSIKYANGDYWDFFSDGTVKTRILTYRYANGEYYPADSDDIKIPYEILRIGTYKVDADFLKYEFPYSEPSDFNCSHISPSFLGKIKYSITKNQLQFIICREVGCGHSLPDFFALDDEIQSTKSLTFKRIN